MDPLKSVLKKPSNFSGDEDATKWFSSIANTLLNECKLVVGSASFRLVEIEFYHSCDLHEDTFAHCDPLQLRNGRWYFHRVGASRSYKSGSFKGLDMTFGDDAAEYGGCLIRSMVSEDDGKIINGPSILVDRILKESGFKKVAELDSKIGGRKVWDDSSPLRLEMDGAGVSRTVYKTARYGLTLKTLGANENKDQKALQYIMSRYRFLTDLKGIKKGKVHAVLALHADGVSVEGIRKKTGSPKASIEKYIADFRVGRIEESFTPYIGVDVDTKTLCRLHGVWHSKMVD